MDILKLLANTTFIDADPASDAEDNKTSVIRNMNHSAPVETSVKKGKGKVKPRLVAAEIDPDELSVESIIADKPGKKKIVKFLKARIQHYLDDDSD